MPLQITAIAAAVLGLIYVVLTARVVMARGKTGASLGDGSTGIVAAGMEHTVPLLVACRSHANFAEYVPLCLVLLGLTEIVGSPRWLVAALAGMLVLARVIHPIGMGTKIPNPFRAGGAALTLLTIIGASVALLLRAANVT